MVRRRHLAGKRVVHGVVRHRPQRIANHRTGRPHPTDERVALHPFAEFGFSIARIASAAEHGAHVMQQVAGQVQNESAGRVLLVAARGPELVVVVALDEVENPAQLSLVEAS